MDKNLNIGALILTFCLGVLVSFAFFATGIRHTDQQYKQINAKQTIVKQQLDSLEKSVNDYYKNKKDTIIINVLPHNIKIYNESTTRH
jgi:peptidoglycan hydrolase CwlO-like protein